jgi:hypothetical protein
MRFAVAFPMDQMAVPDIEETVIVSFNLGIKNRHRARLLKRRFNPSAL